LYLYVLYYNVLKPNALGFFFFFFFFFSEFWLWTFGFGGFGFGQLWSQAVVSPDSAFTNAYPLCVAQTQVTTGRGFASDSLAPMVFQA
ncbi:MAG: hypothetical protein QGH19_03420, partial [Candidatus Woesearchaeota archaeon]|nr:hypothetical protein [Candidatus Woesearchaeota archaeon]